MKKVEKPKFKLSQVSFHNVRIKYNKKIENNVASKIK
jgi:hypothetical protein